MLKTIEVNINLLQLLVSHKQDLSVLCFEGLTDPLYKTF